MNAAPEVPSQSSGAYFQTQTVVPQLNCQNVVLPSRGGFASAGAKAVAQLAVPTPQMDCAESEARALCGRVAFGVGRGGCLWVAATGPPTGLQKGDLALIC